MIQYNILNASLVHLYRIFRGVAKGVERIGLGDFETTNRPIVLAALGGLSISILGVLVPPTMFWSEFEIGVIAEPGTDLPHVWPPVGSGHCFVELGCLRITHPPEKRRSKRGQRVFARYSITYFKALVLSF